MDIYSSKKKARHAKAKTKRPMSKKQKKLMIILISIASALAIVLGTFIGIFIWMTKDYNHNSEIQDDPEFEYREPIAEGIVNIALFGIDTRDTKSFKGRSDSIMILSINKDTGDIKLISLMRDTLVEINKKSGTVYNKINSAYAFGGPALAMKTINNAFDLDISEYATVNFYGMADIVDAVGGIEIDVQEKEINAKGGLNAAIREQAQYLGIKNPPLVTKAGLQKLSGIQAVGWARIRSVSTSMGTANDYGRTDRQRVVMEQLLNKALSKSATEYPAMIKKILPYVETSLSYNDILGLSKVLSKDVDFSQTRVPQSDYVITPPRIQGVGSTVYFNLDFASDIIHAYIYDDIDQETYLAENEIVRKGWYKGPTVSASSSNTTSNNSSNVSSNTTPSDGTTSSDGASSDETSTDETSSNESSSTDSSTDSSSGSSDPASSDPASSEVVTGSSSDEGTGSEPPPLP